MKKKMHEPKLSIRVVASAASLQGFNILLCMLGYVGLCDQ